MKMKEAMAEDQITSGEDRKGEMKNDERRIS